jgi:hypothetical protein
VSETGSVTKPIQEALTKAGYFCMRLNSGLIKSGKRFICLCPAGTADLVLFLPERMPVWIETKALKGKTNREQLEAQGAFRERVERLSHTYVRATCLDDVLAVLRKESQ